LPHEWQDHRWFSIFGMSTGKERDVFMRTGI
jgi:hypothetical protein